MLRVINERVNSFQEVGQHTHASLRKINNMSLARILLQVHTYVTSPPPPPPPLPPRNLSFLKSRLVRCFGRVMNASAREEENSQFSLRNFYAKAEAVR